MSTQFNNRVLSALRFEMILCLVKGDPGALPQMPQHFAGKIDMAIYPCADRCSAERKLAQSIHRFLRALPGVGNLLGITGKFLPQPDRCRVHQMGPADLDDLPKLFRLASSATRNLSKAGMRQSFNCSAALMWIAEGITSLLD